MRPEKRQLLDDLMNDEEAPVRRHATLRAGVQAMQQRRWRRWTARACLAVAAVVATLSTMNPREFFHGQRAAPPSRIVASADTAPRTTVRVEFITDDQLLALFPGTPVGLGRAGGKEWLLFPRPGDEARFIVDAQRNQPR